MSEDTLSDTYMMLPSVVNAIKKPSRACRKRDKLSALNEILDESAYRCKSDHLATW